MSRCDLAIIGYGRFGRFAARHLRDRYNVVVADVKPIPRPDKGITRVSLEEAASCRIVVLATPINSLPGVVKAISPHLARHSLVCDVCSVKELPIRWMKKLLPSSVSILGTHPLFGPDSASRSLRARTIILCPVRISDHKFRSAQSVLSELGLHVRDLTPAVHDRLMASSLFLTQLVGRALTRLHLPQPAISTKNYLFLHHIMTTSRSDTFELFHDMYRYNRFARQIPSQFIRELRRLHLRLRNDT